MNKILERIIFDWGVRCFGIEHMANPRVRAVRLVEEAVELAQSVGVEAAQLRKLVNMVYSRPPGVMYQELGGVMVTTSAFCSCVGIDAEHVLEAEVRRCLKKSPEHFAKRNQEKLQLGMTG